MPPPAMPPLVGRERELGVLRDHLAAALGGQGNLVLVGGEAGIGKTTLAEALCRDATEHGALVLVGRCFDLTDTPAYGPWLYLFERYQPGVDLPPLPPAFAEPGTVGAVASQATLFRQVLDFLRALAATQPVVLLLDDLQWSDPASLDLLRFLAQAVASLRLLILVTYRSDELTRRHPLYQLLPLLVREANAARLDLHTLDDDAVRTLVATRYRLAPADADRLVAYLREHAEGNALFVAELLRTLAEQGALVEDGEGWQLADLHRVAVPALLQQVIDARVSRLGEDAYRLLGVAALIGQDVPLAVWAAVVGEDEETLIAVVEVAGGSRLVEATPDGEGFRFVHALIREALAEGISPLRRRGIHRRVGEALLARPSPDADAVAYHFQQAGDGRATEWLIAAGERAQAAYAWMTAAGRYEAALACIGDTDANARGWLLYRIARLRIHSDSLAYFAEAQRLAAATGDRALAAVAQYGHGLFRCRFGQTASGFAELVAGVEAIEALAADDRARARGVPGLTAVERDAPRGTVLMHAGHSGRYLRALTLGEEWFIPAATAAHADAESPVWADGWSGLADTYTALGRPTEARAAFERARAGYEREGHWVQVGTRLLFTLEVLTLSYAADDVPERERLLKDSVAAFRRSRGIVDVPPAWIATGLRFVEAHWDDPAFAQLEAQLQGNTVSTRALLRPQLARRYRARGERLEAWRHVHAALPRGLATEPGDKRFWDATAMQRIAGALSLDEGNLPAAHAWLEAHDHWLAWSGAVLGQSEGQALWARYHRAAGDIERAHEHARQALAHATEPRQPLALIATHRLVGELETDAGRYESAAAHLKDSLSLADACNAPYERALTQLAIAELSVAMGDATEAVTALDDVRAICTPLRAKPVLTRADALAVRLAVGPARTPPYPGGLSAREVEVLRLVAQGMTDAQVAEHLFLSPRTVGQHLRNIYNKLGVSTRNAAGRWAIEHERT